LVFSNADDSFLLNKLIYDISNHELDEYREEAMLVDCKNAGTVLRFLTAYISTLKQNYILTGSDRMLNRPIGNLVNTLFDLGANIRYEQEAGFPPLRISPANWNIKEIHIDISESSQFVSALLMVLPTLISNSRIIIEGNITSVPYIQMTLDLMLNYGITYSFNDNVIELSGEYIQSANEMKVEVDWSSASYWYEFLAIKGDGQLLLKGLCMNSIQGDVELVKIYNQLGVKSYTHPEGVLIMKSKEAVSEIEIDFANIPDLAPAVIVSCAIMGLKSRFKGLKNLNLKESRRMDVLQMELGKIGLILQKQTDDEYMLEASNGIEEIDYSSIKINHNNDHRIAMAFAPLSVYNKFIKTESPEVVNKSYPSFWDELSKVLM